MVPVRHRPLFDVKSVAILQPGYLPWLGFFDQMASVDVFVYYDDVQFDKHGWRNRNRVKVPGGISWLTVPVLHSGKDWPLVNEIQIDNSRNWRRKHVQTLRQAYSRSLLAPPYIARLEELLSGVESNLAELDMLLIEEMCKWLDINTQTVRSSALGIAGGQSERLLRICQHFGGTHYLSGAAAVDYLDVEMFDRAGVAVKWQTYNHPVYPQLHGSFVSHLSAVDLVLNEGANAAAYFQK